MYDKSWSRNPNAGDTLAEIDREHYIRMEDHASVPGAASGSGTPSHYSINTRISAIAPQGAESIDAAPGINADPITDARSNLFHSLKQPTTLKFPNFPSVTQLSEWNVKVV